MTDIQEHGKELLAEALDQLWAAMIELTRPTFPTTPLPRPPAKPIRVTRDLALWVKTEEKCIVVYVLGFGKQLDKLEVRDITTHTINTFRCAERIVPHLRSPHEIASCLRQLRWLTAWMRKRAEGRRRAAEEILRQQRKWVEMLESEIALRKLAE